MLSVERPNPPPPERPGGAYELPTPPVVSANSAKDNLTPFDFFFVSFTLAAAPSDGKDESSASAGVGSSPSDGNADAGGPRESNPSSFSSVCARERKTHKDRTRQSSRFPPINRPSTTAISVFILVHWRLETAQRNLKKIMHPRRVAHLAGTSPRTRANRREKIPLDAFPIRSPSSPRRATPHRPNPD